MSGGAVNAQQHERRLPDELPRHRVCGLLPDISIPVLRGRHDEVRLRGPVNGRDEFVVLRPTIEHASTAKGYS